MRKVKTIVQKSGVRGMHMSLTPDQTAAAKKLIATDESLLPLFPPVERAFILALKDYFRGVAL